MKKLGNSSVTRTLQVAASLNLKLL